LTKSIVVGSEIEITNIFAQPIPNKESGISTTQLPDLVLGNHYVIVKLTKANGINLLLSLNTTLTRKLTQCT
jgi:hypothetical protein